MALRDKLVIVRQTFFDKTRDMAIEFAIKFGYPENKGMPLVPERLGSDGKPYLGFRVYDNDILSRRDIPYSPPQTADNLIELFVGKFPQIQPLTKFVTESSSDGPYGFSIENYKNLFFLPNLVSEFLQIHLNFCVDISFLEAFREVLFLSIVAFAEIVSIRILVSWLLTINPYTFPWNYFVALVDWTEETLIGLVPSIIGVNLSGPILITILGKCADSLNNLVFTMPYLPSEGEPSKAVINGKLRDVLSFRHLPLLWYEHPIPNELRNYWYNERPDIIVYMQHAYKGLNIQFLPDGITQDVFEDSILDFLFGKPLSEEVPQASEENQTLLDQVPQASEENQTLLDHAPQDLKESTPIVNPMDEHWEKDHIVTILNPETVSDHLISKSYFIGILPDGVTLPHEINEQNISISESLIDFKEIDIFNCFKYILTRVPIELTDDIKLGTEYHELIDSITSSNLIINQDLISTNCQMKFNHVIDLLYFTNDYNHFF